MDLIKEGNFDKWGNHGCVITTLHQITIFSRKKTSNSNVKTERKLPKLPLRKIYLIRSVKNEIF